MRQIEAKEILKNPSAAKLRELARHEEITTEFGSPCYITKVRSRSAKNTFIVDDVPLGVTHQQGVKRAEAEALAAKVREHLKGRRMVEVNRTMGMSDYALRCRLYIPQEFARIALMWHKSLFEPRDGGEPDFVSVYVPDWPERYIFADPVQGVNYILGTDYFGEAKKSFLRLAMYHIKKHGGLGLHAGSKILRVRHADGKAREVGFIMFGLSGTGKTTLTMHDHGLTGQEGIVIRQDDVILMRKDGHCYGTEDGFFIKTDGLEPSQRVLWNAATTPEAAFENIWVDKESGKVDFLNTTLTSNGRGIVRRVDVEGTDHSVDLPKANKIIFITRRDDVVPAAVRLNPAQAAAYFMLGESIETSAGDPTQAGKAKRQVGTNPFIIGPESEEGHRLADILTSNAGMQCYLLNTGRVGKLEGRSEGRKISVHESSTLIREIARDGIEWKKDPDWGYEVPARVPGMEAGELDPRKFYSGSEYGERVEKLRRERVQWLEQFPGLNPEIRSAVEKPRS